MLCQSGCASAPPPQPNPAAGRSPRCSAPAGAPRRLVLGLWARTPGAAAPRPLRPGDVVRSGEGLAVTLAPAEPLHLYLAYRSSQGSWQRLYQDGEDGPRAEPLRLPAGDGWLVLDDHAGTETLVVAASHAPLWSAAPELCRSLPLRCTPRDGRGDEREPPPPPPGTDQPNRGSGEQSADSLALTTDTCGVALHSVQLRHEP